MSHWCPQVLKYPRVTRAYVLMVIARSKALLGNFFVSSTSQSLTDVPAAALDRTTARDTLFMLITSKEIPSRDRIRNVVGNRVAIDF